MNFSHQIKYFAAVLLVLPTAQAMTLVENGEARARIVLCKDASQVEEYAARELQGAVQRATGATLEIVKGEAEPSAAQIVLGTPENTPAIAALNKLNASDEADSILIFTQDDTLFLGGSNPRSVLYAVTRFLEESLGFRWLWPGEEGEFVHKTSDCKTGSLDILEAAGIPRRSLAINSPHYDLDTLNWMARHRFNMHPVNAAFNDEKNASLSERGFLIRYAGHNLVLPQKVLEKHPEYAAEFGGERHLRVNDEQAHLCWSNPGVQAALVESVTEWIGKNPQVDIWSFYPTDHGRFCQCKNCIAMSSDVSTRFQKLSAIIIEAVRKSFPKAKFSTLAYQAYREIPKEVAPFSEIGYCHYNVSYQHPLGSGHPANDTALHEIRGWKKLGVPVSLRGYNMVPFKNPMFVPLVSYLREEIAFSQREGLVNWATEVTPFGHPASQAPEKRNWDTNRINLYAIGRALWNPGITAEQIVDEWTQAIYGDNAAAPMKRYYFAMEKAWTNTPEDITYFLHPPAPFARGFISEELIKTADDAFAEARQILSGEADETFRKRALEQVHLEEKMFNEWREYYKLIQADEGRFNVVATRSDILSEELMNPHQAVWNNAPRLPKFQAEEKEVKDQTEVSLLWDDDTLYLRVLSHDSTPDQRAARFIEHDQQIYSDDSIEIFLNRPEGGYWHLAVNSLGARYDAESKGGMNLDITPNPDWSVRVEMEKNAWLAVIALPLKEFGYAAKENAEIPISIKRTRPGKLHPNSGWPDDAYHSPSSHGSIRLAAKAPKRISLYRGEGVPENRSAALEVSLRRKGWSVHILQDEADFDAQNCDVLFLRYGTGGEFRLSSAFLQESVLPWVREGGVLLVSASGNVALVRWFRSDLWNTRWTGWDIHPLRRSIDITEGDWLQSPNNLESVLRKGVTPSSGFIPTSPEWETLATLRMKDGSTAAYLLRAHIGEGFLYLTTSNMAYGGGNEIFGSSNPERAADLIENFSHALN